MATNIKQKTLLKRKMKGLERESTVHSQFMVTKIHHTTQILMMAHQQNLQNKKYPRMNIPHQGFLPSLQRKNLNENLTKHISDQEIKESMY